MKAEKTIREGEQRMFMVDVEQMVHYKAVHREVQKYINEHLQGKARLFLSSMMAGGSMDK